MAENKPDMVLGFMFSEAMDLVMLISKVKPDWQAGYLNGIGGKVEREEMPFEAMSREFQEETTLKYSDWAHCISFQCQGGVVHVFKGKLPIDQLVRLEGIDTENNGERIHCVSTTSSLIRERGLYNLRWMIPLLKDHIEWPISFIYDSSGGCVQEAEYLKKVSEL